jgi:hypothetical protein
MRNELKLIALLSFFSLLGRLLFFQLELVTQFVAIVVLVLTLLHVTFFPNRKNAQLGRNKIYIVALCWVGVTLVLPLINAHIPLGTDFYLKCMQFLSWFCLDSCFEILDLTTDDPHLQTVPQRIGVKKTKIVGLSLLLPFYFLEFLKNN